MIAYMASSTRMISLDFICDTILVAIWSPFLIGSSSFGLLVLHALFIPLRVVLRVWMALIGSSGVHIQEPVPGSCVKCVYVTGNANIFAVDYDSTLYEVVPHNAFLLPLFSISRVLHFGIDTRSRMPFLALEAYNVSCNVSDGRDHKVLSMRVMMWTGILRKVWVRNYVAQNL